MLPYSFPSMAALREAIDHFGMYLDGDDIRDKDSRKLKGWIQARGKRKIRVAWFF